MCFGICRSVVFGVWCFGVLVFGVLVFWCFELLDRVLVFCSNRGRAVKGLDFQPCLSRSAGPNPSVFCGSCFLFLECLSSWCFAFRVSCFVFRPSPFAFHQPTFAFHQPKLAPRRGSPRVCQLRPWALTRWSRNGAQKGLATGLPTAAVGAN